MTRQFIARVSVNAPQAFSARLAELEDAIVGGFIKNDGSVEFVVFSRAVPGHQDATAYGLVTGDCMGGFSIFVKHGKVTCFVFRSTLNQPDIYLQRRLQAAIIRALPKSDDWRLST